MQLPTRRLITLGVLAAAVSPARAAGLVLLMRHATAPGTGDPAGFVLGDCTTQRTLSDEGRAESVRAGAYLRRVRIRVDRLLSSRYCRCQETARLLDLGPVEDFPPLDSFYADAAEGPARTAAVKALLRDNPDRGIALVTHQVNITALTGIFPRPAEIILAQVGARPSDPLTVVDRIGVELRKAVDPQPSVIMDRGNGGVSLVSAGQSADRAAKAHSTIRRANERSPAPSHSSANPIISRGEIILATGSIMEWLRRHIMSCPERDRPAIKRRN